MDTFLVGAATTLVVQLVIYFWVVPRVDARKRREDRWERDVRELDELLTTSLGNIATEAYAAQAGFRHVRQLEGAAGVDIEKLAHLRSEQSLKARQATVAFTDLAHTRVPRLVGRVKSIDPASDKIIKFGCAARHYQIRAIIVDDWSQDYVHPDATFDEAWDQERDARRALLAQVEVLAELPHPPRELLVRRCWRRGASLVHRAISWPRRASAGGRALGT